MRVENITVKVGKSLMIELNVTDNIGIASVIWSGLPIESNGTVAEGKIGRPGKYVVVVTVLDVADNQAETEFTIIVEEEEGKGPLGYMVLVTFMVLLLLVGILFLRKGRWSGRKEEDRPK